ncbi:MAG: hemin uptake protein HemP [Methylophilaceae bacterium]|nr:hemin uptake protein HemP [Methylophilaceae bacterium]
MKQNADIMQPRAGSKPESRMPAMSNRIRSHDILGGHREIVILHGDDEYRLRLTRQGKLILTK